MILDITLGDNFLIILFAIVFLYFLARMIKYFMEENYETEKYINEGFSNYPLWYYEKRYEEDDDISSKFNKLPYGAYGRDIVKRKKK